MPRQRRTRPPRAPCPSPRCGACAPAPCRPALEPFGVLRLALHRDPDAREAVCAIDGAFVSVSGFVASGPAWPLPATRRIGPFARRVSAGAAAVCVIRRDRQSSGRGAVEGIFGRARLGSRRRFCALGATRRRRSKGRVGAFCARSTASARLLAARFGGVSRFPDRSRMLQQRRFALLAGKRPVLHRSTRKSLIHKPRTTP